MPETFTVNGKSYTPQSWMEALKIDPQDYVQLTSFTHHPFYQSFVLEIPDNWTASQVYNIPLEELQMVIDSSLEAGYAVNWAADVSEKGFAFDKGFAIVPVTEAEEVSGFGQGPMDEVDRRRTEENGSVACRSDSRKDDYPANAPGCIR